MTICSCACHTNKLNKPYEHDTVCCEAMNGFVVGDAELREDISDILDLDIARTELPDYVDAILALFQTHQTALIDRIIAELPEKDAAYVKESVELSSILDFMKGYNTALDEVLAVLEGMQ